MNHNEVCYLLVDGGGTKTVLRLLDSHYRLIGEAKSTSGNIKTSVEGTWHSIQLGLDQIIKQANYKLKKVIAVMGLAGCESYQAVEQFKQLKPDYFTELHVYSDAYIACLGAHGGCDGALVIVGTGIKGIQIENNALVDIAGWGFPYSDEGSGAWIGLEAIRHTFQVIDGRSPKSQLSEMILSDCNNNPHGLLEGLYNALPKVYGKFCHYVVKGVLQKDKASLLIMERAAVEVVRVIEALAKKTTSTYLPLSLSGGLSEYITPFLPEKIASRLVKYQKDALDGALLQLKKINNIL